MALDSEIVKGYVPGSIGRIAELHATYYQRHAGFGLYFEAKVARELGEFLQRYDERRDAIWLARYAGRVEGSIVIDGIDAGTEGAHLRWFIASDALRGSGFEGLDVARHLYEKNGFRLTLQRLGMQWGKEVTEQRFELRI
jgi:hypothetical protein